MVFNLKKQEKFIVELYKNKTFFAISKEMFLFFLSTSKKTSSQLLFILKVQIISYELNKEIGC